MTTTQNVVPYCGRTFQVRYNTFGAGQRQQLKCKYHLGIIG
jgi:hypothetical protein